MLRAIVARPVRTGRSSLRAGLSLLAAVTMLAACAADGSTGPTKSEPSIAGTYNAVSAAGKPLPYTVMVDNQRVDILSETFVLTDRGTFTLAAVARVFQNGQTVTGPVKDAGTFTRSGASITLKLDSNGSTHTGTVAPGRLTIEDWVYLQ